MRIEVVKTKLEGVLLIKPEIFEDFRGFYAELYNKKLYKKHGIDAEFVQDDISVSSQNVLRGIHGDDKTWKLFTCLRGRIYFVVVNCDRHSEHFGKWESFLISESNRHQVLVPPSYGNGHLALSPLVTLHYKQSGYYVLPGQKGSQFSYRFNDSQFNIWWPVKNPILSRRDEEGRYVE